MILYLIFLIVLTSTNAAKDVRVNGTKYRIADMTIGETEIQVGKGESIKLICLSPNEFADTVRIDWLKNMVVMEESKFPRIVFSRMGLLLNNLKPSDSGVYGCGVTDEFEHSVNFRRTIKVTVTKPEKPNDEEDEDGVDTQYSCDKIMRAPKFDKQRKFICFDLNASKKRMNNYLVKAAGTQISLYCNAKGNPEPVVTWYKDDGVFNPVGFHHNRLPNNGLLFKELTVGDEATYTCEANNSYSSIRYEVGVRVIHSEPSKPIITRFRNMTVLTGEDARLECDVVSSEYPLLAIQFLSVREDQNRTVESRTKNETILYDQRLLFLENVTQDDAGWYTCVAANSLGRSGVSVYLDVVTEVKTGAAISQVKDDNLTLILIVAIFGFGVLVAAIITVIWYMGNKHQVKKLKLKMQQQGAKGWTKQVIIERVQANSNENDEGAVLIPEVNIRNVVANRTNDQEYEIPTDERWEFPRDRLELGKHLGEGAFGEVRQGMALGILERGIPTTVAVKSLKKTHTDAEMIDLISEMETMKEFGKHSNIINLLGCCTVGGELLVIMEYAEHGSLLEFLRDNRHHFMYERPKPNPNTMIQMQMDFTNAPVDDALTFKDLMSFAYQVARGMDYLVQRKYVHRDLAARNVLVAANKIVKIADFGMTRSTFANNYYRKKTDGRVPIKWMAPETLIHRIYTTQSDVWSYGILLWEIVTLGGTPYPAMPDMNKLLEFVKTGKRMDQPPNCPSELYMIMRDCWSDAPSARPSFGSLVEDIGRILYLASETEYFELEGMQVQPFDDVITPQSSPENSAQGMIMFDPEFVKSFSEP